MKEANEGLQCVMCRRDLDLGMDVYGVQQGVIGQRGFVPLELEDWTLCCCEPCLSEYYGEPEEERVP